MNDRVQLPAADEAQTALDSVSQLTTAGLERGLYPRWFALATAVWAGSITALIALESPIWLWLMPTGLLGYYVYRRRKGAWVQEVHRARDFWLVVIPCATVLCAVALAGIVGWQEYRLFWAPIIAGTVVAVGLFTLMEVTYGPVRARLRSEDRA